MTIPTPYSRDRDMSDEVSDCGPDVGCEECDVCRYLNFLEWAGSVAPAGSTIERNATIESYLRQTYPGAFA